MTFFAVSVHHHLALAASTAVRSPPTTPCRHRSMNCSETSSSVSISARRKRLCWKLPIGCPNALRSLAYCTVCRQVSRAPAIAEIAMPSRSEGILHQVIEPAALLAEHVGSRHADVLEVKFRGVLGV